MAQDFPKDRDWDTNANWNSGAKPASNDDVVIPDTLGVDMDTGLDQSAVDLNSLFLHPGYAKRLGTSSSPLRLAADLITHQGSGAFYIASSKAGGSTLIDEIRIMCQDPGVLTEISAESGDEGEVAIVRALRGTTVIKGTTLFPAAGLVEVGFIDDRTGDSNVTLETNSDTLSDFKQWGGNCLSQIAITTAEISSGTLFQDSKLITNLNITGGTVTYNHTALTTVHVYGGVLDLSQRYSLDMTITDLFIYPGAIVYGQFTEGITPIQGPIIVTNLHKFGGEIIPFNPNRIAA